LDIQKSKSDYSSNFIYKLEIKTTVKFTYNYSFKLAPSLNTVCSVKKFCHKIQIHKPHYLQYSLSLVMKESNVSFKKNGLRHQVCLTGTMKQTPLLNIFFVYISWKKRTINEVYQDCYLVVHVKSG